MYFDPTQHVLPNTQKIYIHTPPKSKKCIVFWLWLTTNVLCEVITKEYWETKQLYDIDEKNYFDFLDFLFEADMLRNVGGGQIGGGEIEKIQIFFLFRSIKRFCFLIFFDYFFT